MYINGLAEFRSLLLSKEMNEMENTNSKKKSEEDITSERIDDLIDRILEGVVQNICLEIDKQGITIRGLGELADVNYSHLSRMVNGQTRIGLTTLIKLAYALHVSPSELFPFDVNKRKTNGQRFDEITKEMDISSSNFLLGLCADYSKEWRRIKRNL